MTRGRERRLRPADAGKPRSEVAHARRDARAGAARAARGPAPVAAVRRPAAARRAGARAGAGAAVLLLDEPLSALDLKLRQAMRVELKRIQRETGITFVFVTHDQEEALTMSDRIAVMSAGECSRSARPGHLRTAAQPLRRRLHRRDQPAGRHVQRAGARRGLRLQAGRRHVIEALPAARHAAVQRARVDAPETPAPASAGATRPASGVVDALVYLGTDTHYHVRLDDRHAARARAERARAQRSRAGRARSAQSTRARATAGRLNMAQPSVPARATGQPPRCCWRRMVDHRHFPRPAARADRRLLLPDVRAPMAASSGYSQPRPTCSSCSRRTFSPRSSISTRPTCRSTCAPSCRRWSPRSLPGIGFPDGLLHRHAARAQRIVWVFLVTVPYWVNLLIRTVSMLFIIRDEGPLNALLLRLGAIASRCASPIPTSPSGSGSSTATCHSWCCRSTRRSNASTSRWSRPRTIFTPSRWTTLRA